jgi:hypothetical protein
MPHANATPTPIVAPRRLPLHHPNPDVVPDVDARGVEDIVPHLSQSSST